MVALLQLLSSCKTAQSSCIIHNCTHAYNIHVYTYSDAHSILNTRAYYIMTPDVVLLPVLGEVTAFLPGKAWPSHSCDRSLRLGCGLVNGGVSWVELCN